MDNKDEPLSYEERAKAEQEKRIERFMELLERGPDKPTPEEDAADPDDHSGHRARLRERLKHDRALDGFDDVRLLELALSFATPRRDTEPAARALLDRFGTPADVLAASEQELRSVPYVTADAAKLLTLVDMIASRASTRGIIINSPDDARAFFGSLVLGGADEGLYAAFLDGADTVLAFERYEADVTELRSIVGSAVKYDARYCIAMRRTRALFPDAFALTKFAGKLNKALSAVGVKLLDFPMFTDDGYYTVDLSDKPDPDRKFVFIPSIFSARSQLFAHLLRSVPKTVPPPEHEDD